MNRTFAAPLNAVDRVRPTADGASVTKRIVATDPYLEGHYPGFPIYPGVFTVETVYQAARGLLEGRLGAGARVELATVRSVRFVAPLLAGDELTSTCVLGPGTGDLVRVKADCRRSDGAVAAKIDLELRVHPDADR